eukprot:GHVH01007833.1.p1 GENE.GHVH01007833.1~~GHVH01007833.1.p1  ORF type:complete len:925 (+),score=123.30 GHVH01007833.1:80-2854(+)
MTDYQQNLDFLKSFTNAPAGQALSTAAAAGLKPSIDAANSGATTFNERHTTHTQPVNNNQPSDSISLPSDLLDELNDHDGPVKTTGPVGLKQNDSDHSSDSTLTRQLKGHAPKPNFGTSPTPKAPTLSPARKPSHNKAFRSSHSSVSAKSKRESSGCCASMRRKKKSKHLDPPVVSSSSTSSTRPAVSKLNSLPAVRGPHAAPAGGVFASSSTLFPDKAIPKAIQNSSSLLEDPPLSITSSDRFENTIPSIHVSKNSTITNPAIYYSDEDTLDEVEPATKVISRSTSSSRSTSIIPLDKASSHRSQSNHSYSSSSSYPQRPSPSTTSTNSTTIVSFQPLVSLQPESHSMRESSAQPQPALSRSPACVALQEVKPVRSISSNVEEEDEKVKKKKKKRKTRQRDDGNEGRSNTEVMSMQSSFTSYSDLRDWLMDDTTTDDSGSIAPSCIYDNDHCHSCDRLVTMNVGHGKMTQFDRIGKRFNPSFVHQEEMELPKAYALTMAQSFNNNEKYRHVRMSAPRPWVMKQGTVTFPRTKGQPPVLPKPTKPSSGKEASVEYSSPSHVPLKKKGVKESLLKKSTGDVSHSDLNLSEDDIFLPYDSDEIRGHCGKRYYVKDGQKMKHKRQDRRTNDDPFPRGIKNQNDSLSVISRQSNGSEDTIWSSDSSDLSGRGRRHKKNKKPEKDKKNKKPEKDKKNKKPEKDKKDKKNKKNKKPEKDWKHESSYSSVSNCVQAKCHRGCCCSLSSSPRSISTISTVSSSVNHLRSKPEHRERKHSPPVKADVKVQSAREVVYSTTKTSVECRSASTIPQKMISMGGPRAISVERNTYGCGSYGTLSPIGSPKPSSTRMPTSPPSSAFKTSASHSSKNVHGSSRDRRPTSSDDSLTKLIQSVQVNGTEIERIKVQEVTNRTGQQQWQQESSDFDVIVLR